MPYAPLPAEPYPPGESWFLAVWNEETDAWLPCRPSIERAEAVKRLLAMRTENPEMIIRLVRENRFYTAEED